VAGQSCNDTTLNSREEKRYAFLYRCIATLFVILAELCTPTLAMGSTISDAEIWAKYPNNTRYDVTFSNVRWSGRYGTANSDGTVGDRIQGTVAPGKTVPSHHRMGDPDIGERYTKLSFDATFTRDNGTKGSCSYYYAFKSATGELSASAALTGGDDKLLYPKCTIIFNSYYNLTFDMTGIDPNKFK
jgi:hypothetical protein